jgi:hypothetical protein
MPTRSSISKRRSCSTQADEGALDPGQDASKAIVVTGSWFIDPADKTALVIDYKIGAKGQKRVERVVWRFQDDKLVLTRGRVPPEVTRASEWWPTPQ